MFRVRALRLRLLIGCCAIIAAFVAVAVRQVDAQLHAAYADSGRAQAESVARTFRLRERTLSRADLGQQLERLRRQTPRVERVDLFVRRQNLPLKIISTD